MAQLTRRDLWGLEQRAWYGTVRMLALASADEWQAGMRWYPSVRAELEKAADEGGTTLWQAAAITAALSPQTGWDENLAAALKFIRTGLQDRSLVGLGTSWDKAQRILDGERPSEVLGGNKVRSFAQNLIREDSRAVTIDTWMMRIFGLGSYPTRWRKGEYDALRRGVIRAADHFKIEASQAQAIAWLVYRQTATRQAGYTRYRRNLGATEVLT